MEWQLADAKNRFSEVVTKALTVGPQWVRRRDGLVVVLSAEEYHRIKGQRMTLKEFLLSGPDISDLDLARDESPAREVEW